MEAGPARAVAHEHAAVDELLPERVAVAVHLEQHEVRTRRERGDPVDALECGEQPFPLGDEPIDPVVHRRSELERDPARDLRCRGEVVREHDLFELLHDPRRRDREAEPERGHRPHLRVRAHHHEPAVVAHEFERAARRELAVRLVDDDQAVGRVEQRLDGVGVFDGAGGVVGAAHEHDRGLLFGDELRTRRRRRSRSRRAAPPRPLRCR